MAYRPLKVKDAAGNTFTVGDPRTGSKADKDSPALTGTPTAPTAAVDTSTTQVATTAFVVGQAATATPLVDGTAAVGTSKRFARADHRHPQDTDLLNTVSVKSAEATASASSAALSASAASTSATAAASSASNAASSATTASSASLSASTSAATAVASADAASDAVDLVSGYFGTATVLSAQFYA